jgi:hypothetical protein
MPRRRPNPADQVTTLDTSGVRGGAHARLPGITAVFDIEAERVGRAPARDVSVGERFSEKVSPAPGEVNPLIPHDPAGHQQARVGDQGDDTSGLATQGASDAKATQVSIDEAVRMDTTAPTTAPRDPAEIGIQSQPPVQTSPTGLVTEEESPSAPVVEEGQDLSGLTVAELRRLATERNVTVKSGATKAEIVAAIEGGGE